MRAMITAFLGLTLLTAATEPVTDYQPAGSIERKYFADGPWETTTAATGEPCDREGHVCDIWYPTALGSNKITGAEQGFRHPVIVYANGTAFSVPPEKNASFLRHLASWGFVVIRSRDGATGAGDTVLDVARYITALGSNPSSKFLNKIDGDNVGLTGHSQGGATAVRLFSEQKSPFKTFVPIETPIRSFCLIAGCSIAIGALTKVTSGSIFFIGGEDDLVSSEATNRGYYAPIPNQVDKVMAIVAGGSHTEIEGDPTCAGATKGTCNIGVFPLLGFPTAWFMWKLQGATDAREAFRQHGELAQATAAWKGVASSIQ